MAFMSQEKKASIAVELKKVMPKGWKYSLAVRHHSTLVLTIRQTPNNILAYLNESPYFNPKTATNADLNVYYIERQIADPALLQTFRAILDAMNAGNWDRSDPQTDYFNVGWYVEVKIGDYSKPLKMVA